MLGRFLPSETLQILSGEAHKIAVAGNGALGLSLLVGIVLTLYSVTRGTRAIILGCNIAYGETERRGFIRLSGLTASALTLSLMLYFLFLLGLGAGLPAAIRLLSVLPPVSDSILPLAALASDDGDCHGGAGHCLPFWPRCHSHSRPVWFSRGSLAATALWLVWSSLFFLLRIQFWPV